jgi:HD-GYP domain-containing protein (c-di-GMP phosphodiesterase class II)
MIRVIVREARAGMTLARAVINPRQSDQTLLPPGYPLDARTLAQLHELGVYDLWVNYPGLDFLDDLYSAELSSQQHHLCETLRSAFLEQAQRAGTPLPMQEFRTAVEDLVHTVLDSAGTIPFLSMLAGEEDALLKHSSDVCVLGVVLGLRLEGYLVEQRKRIATRHARDIVNLGLGCLLHDVGELQLHPAFRESRRPFAFDPEPPAEWLQHPELGYAAVRSQLEPSAATIVLNHHQHFDGSGFPRILASGSAQCGSHIHIFSRIAMAADTFAHLLHKDGVPQPAIIALWQIQQNPIRPWFDPKVLAALLAVVPPFIPGMVVTLSDHRQAIITRIHEDAPCYPEVQTLQGMNLMSSENAADACEVIDLAACPKLHVTNVDGFEVADYLYGPRHATESSQLRSHEYAVTAQ